MEIKPIAFNEVCEDAAGIVDRGCDLSDPANGAKFIELVTNLLVKHLIFPAGSTPDDVWKDIRQCTTKCGQRTDIIYFLKDDITVDWGRFAMLRLHMAPDWAWIEDWLNNDAKHFGKARRGPHKNLYKQLAADPEKLAQIVENDPIARAFMNVQKPKH